MNPTTPLTGGETRRPWGDRNALVKTEKLGNQGDTFLLQSLDLEQPNRFVILAVETTPLGFVSEHLHTYAGAEEPEAFIEEWRTEYGNFDPDREEWLHVFSEEGHGDRVLHRMRRDWHVTERVTGSDRANSCGWCGAILPTAEALGGHKSGCLSRNLWTRIMTSVEQEVHQ